MEKVEETIVQLKYTNDLTNSNTSSILLDVFEFFYGAAMTKTLEVPDELNENQKACSHEYSDRHVCKHCGVRTKPMTETERLESQLDKFQNILNTAFKDNDERLEGLATMYADYGTRILEAPASSTAHFHNAYAGGYIDHVLNVHDNAVQMSKALRKANGWIDFTYAELAMAALHHDLWKLGNPRGEAYYLIQDSDWHRKTLGQMFKKNEKLQHFNVTDGALYVLQSYNIKLTEKEWLAIKLSDGLYDDSNKSYLMNHGKFPMHTNLPYVIHWADHMSATSERDPMKQAFLTPTEDEGE